MNPRVQAVGRRTFAALRFRNYRYYFFAQVVSFSGTWMQMIAHSWLVLELTGSGTALGSVMATQFLPTLLLAPVGGMLADRLDKRRLIIATQTCAGSLALALGVVTLTGVVELWMVYALAAGFGVVTAIDNPARQTFVMEMVGAADVANAVTLNSVVVNAARAIGPAIGGVIIATVGIGECFVVNAFSYLVVIATLVALRTDELHPAARSARAPGQLRDGLRYVRRTPMLRTLLIMLAVIGTLTYEFTTTLPLLAEFTFGAGASGLAMMTALSGAGAVVGGLVVASAGTPTPARLVAVVAAFGVAVLALSAAPTLTVAYLTMPVVGACSVGCIAMSNSLLQLHSAAELRGRVMAFFSMALLGSTPLGGPFVGWLADVVSPRFSLVVGGVAALAAGAFGRLRLPADATEAPTRAVAVPDTAVRPSVPAR